MSLVTIIIAVFILVILAYNRTPKEPKHTNIEVISDTRRVEVEIIDEMTKEKVRNLYEEQEMCNAKISYLTRQNKRYECDIIKLDEKIQSNLNDMRTQLMIQPDLDIKILKAGYEEGNQNIYKHRLKLEGMILANTEKIISYKKKSNAINEQITEIGKEVYKQQIM